MWGEAEKWAARLPRSRLRLRPDADAGAGAAVDARGCVNPFAHAGEALRAVRPFVRALVQTLPADEDRDAQSNVRLLPLDAQDTPALMAARRTHDVNR